LRGAATHNHFAPPENVISWLLESIDTRRSRHGDAQIMSYFTLSLLLDFVCMATWAACLSQNVFSNCTLRTTW